MKVFSAFVSLLLIQHVSAAKSSEEIMQTGVSPSPFKVESVWWIETVPVDFIKPKLYKLNALNNDLNTYF